MKARSSPAGGLGREFLDGILESLEFLNGVPNSSKIYQRVRVNQEIPGIDHVTPWNFRRPCFRFIRKMSRGLADNPELPNDGVLNHLVLAEGGLTVGDIGLDPVDGHADVREELSFVPMPQLRDALPPRCFL